MIVKILNAGNCEDDKLTVEQENASVTLARGEYTQVNPHYPVRFQVEHGGRSLGEVELDDELVFRPLERHQPEGLPGDFEDRS